jgi:methionine-gamma-lyase
MPRHDANGLAIAQALQDHPTVARVHYPGLASHPQHALASAQMSGFGGVLAVEFTDGFAAADTFLGRLRYARRSASLGGSNRWPCTRRRCGAACSARTR